MGRLFHGWICFSGRCIVDFDWPPEMLMDCHSGSYKYLGYNKKGSSCFEANVFFHTPIAPPTRRRNYLSLAGLRFRE